MYLALFGSALVLGLVCCPLPGVCVVAFYFLRNSSPTHNRKPGVTWEKEEDRLGEGGSVMILVDYWSIGRNASTENLDMSQ